MYDTFMAEDDEDPVSVSGPVMNAEDGGYLGVSPEPQKVEEYGYMETANFDDWEDDDQSCLCE